MSIVYATDDTFEKEVIKSKGLIITDFWAEWCGPCKMIDPILEEISKEMGDEIKIVKINVDESPTPPTQFGIRSIPTLMLFKDGQLLDSKVGITPKSALINWINSHK